MLSMSCEKEPPVTPPSDDSAIIKLEQSSIEVEDAGGEVKVGYTVDNPIAGAKALLISSVEWIVAAESEENNLVFTVESNLSSESRTAELIVRYPSAEEVTLNVTQLAEASAQFGIEVQSTNYNSFKTEITAANKDMHYVLYMSSVDYFQDMSIDTDEGLFLDDKAFFEEYAEYYGMNLGDFMEEYKFVFQGDRISDWTDLIPANRYAVYVYGIEFNADRSDYTRVTPVYYDVAETPINDIGEQAFEVNIEINGPEATLSIGTNGYTGNYACYLFSELEELYMPEGGAVNEAYTLAMAQQWMRDYNSYSGYSNMSNAEILENKCYKGDNTIINTLNASSNYTLVVFAIEEKDGVLLLSSEPIVKNFKTGDVEQSDMTFELTLNGAYSRVVDITVKPSDENETYTILLVKRDMLGDLTDGDEIVEWAVTSYWLSEYVGEYNYYNNYLSPDTDYSLLVFGFYANAATTGLTRLDFKTEPEAEAENNVARIDFNGPYDPMAIYALDQSDPSLTYYEGYFVMWMETIAENPDYADVYHYIYDTDTIEAWGDEGIFEDLTAYYYEPVGTAPGQYGMEYRIVATLQDAKGNYCDMFFSDPFTYNESDLRDPQEFIDKVYYGETRSQGRMVVVGRNGVQIMPEAKPSFESVAPSVVTPTTNKRTAQKYDKLAK